MAAQVEGGNQDGNEQRKSMSRSIAAESEQLLGVVRRAALSYYCYALCMSRYPEARGEDMRRLDTLEMRLGLSGQEYSHLK